MVRTLIQLLCFRKLFVGLVQLIKFLPKDECRKYGLRIVVLNYEF
jgi:hypothetical protein